MTTKYSLQGKIIITTQPADQAMELLKLLREKRALAFNLPMIETRTLEFSWDNIQLLHKLHFFDLLVFTSKKGVRGFFENLQKYVGNTHLPLDLKIAAVGEGTAGEIEESGFYVDFLNPGKNAAELAEYLLSDVVKSNGSVLLALGTSAPDFLQQKLSTKARVSRINTYETLPVPEVDSVISGYIKRREADICIFTSPSGFQSFLNIFGNVLPVEFAAIGNTTANFIKQKGFGVAVTAPYPSPVALVDALESYFAKMI